MFVLVTGGSGFIGTNVCLSLLKEGTPFINVDLQPPRITPLIPSWVKGDVRDKTFLIQTMERFAPRKVLHLAARTDLAGANLSEYSSNTDGVRSIITAVNSTDSVSRVLFASSRLVCRIGYQPTDMADYCPTTVYGESKVIGEKLVRELCQDSQWDWAIFRPTSIWGPWFGVPYRNFFDAVIKRRYVHPGVEPLWKSFGYVENSVHQIFALLNTKFDIQGATLYLADHEPIEVGEFSKKIADIAKVAPPTVVSPLILKTLAHVGDISGRLGVKNFPLTSFRLNNLMTQMIYDTETIKQIAGELPFSTIDGISRTVNWMKTNSRNDGGV